MHSLNADAHSELKHLVQSILAPSQPHTGGWKCVYLLTASDYTYLSFLFPHLFFLKKPSLSCITLVPGVVGGQIKRTSSCFPEFPSCSIAVCNDIATNAAGEMNFLFSDSKGRISRLKYFICYLCANSREPFTKVWHPYLSSSPHSSSSIQLHKILLSVFVTSLLLHAV